MYSLNTVHAACILGRLFNSWLKVRMFIRRIGISQYCTVFWLECSVDTNIVHFSRDNFLSLHIIQIKQKIGLLAIYSQLNRIIVNLNKASC